MIILRQKEFARYIAPVKASKIIKEAKESGIKGNSIEGVTRTLLRPFERAKKSGLITKEQFQKATREGNKKLGKSGQGGSKYASRFNKAHIDAIKAGLL